VRRRMAAAGASCCSCAVVRQVLLHLALGDFYYFQHTHRNGVTEAHNTTAMHNASPASSKARDKPHTSGTLLTRSPVQTNTFRT